MCLYPDNWGGLNSEDNATYEALYAQYVPACGACETLGGEILRAISKIVYRFYNDGDTVSRYYGSDYNMLKGADRFLLKYADVYESLGGIYDDLAYEKKMCGMLKCIVDFLKDNPELFETPNDDDYLNYQVYDPIQYDDEDDW